MKKLFSLVLVLLFSFSPQAHARGFTFNPGEFRGMPVAVGTSVRVVGYSPKMWWTVANPNGIGPFKSGAQCQMQEGGVVKAIAVDDIRILFSYTTAKKRTGEQCPSGALFYERVDHFNSLKWQERLNNQKR